MKDQRALAYVNMFAVLGSIPKLIELDGDAKELIKKDKISIGFDVKGGPRGTLVFENGEAKMLKGLVDPTIKLPFKSPEKFNGMIDGTVTPIPSKGFLRIGFLLKKFVKLTDILERYLRASADDLKDEEFFIKSTTLMLTTIANAVAELGNNDKVSMASASYIVDGKISLMIGGGPEIAVVAKNHKLSVSEDTDNYRSYMKFKDMKTARDLFDGNINAVAAVGFGDVAVGGMISQVDNVNRILDRVALYLA